jgi:tRNA U34 5-methylaminomethyl-2-thiouridine-forming methyltransferase MnmC
MMREETSEIRVVETDDGSRTLYLPGLDETYHSTHGAVTESRHVYIEKGLDFWRAAHPKAKAVTVFEMGLGTGTNAMLAMDWCVANDCKMRYYSVEKFPLGPDLMKEYWGPKSLIEVDDLVSQDVSRRSDAMHSSPWEQWIEIPLGLGGFEIFKHKSDIRDAEIPDEIDVVFWDAFGPKKQDGVWGAELFQPIFNAMQQGGIFVTYSASGDVKRALKEVGFGVEKLDGPPYKRHTCCAQKKIETDLLRFKRHKLRARRV